MDVLSRSPRPASAGLVFIDDSAQLTLYRHQLADTHSGQPTLQRLALSASNFARTHPQMATFGPAHAPGLAKDGELDGGCWLAMVTLLRSANMHA